MAKVAKTWAITRKPVCGNPVISVTFVVRFD